MSNEKPQSPRDIKRAVLEHLNRHKREFNDGSNTLKAATMKLNGEKGAPKGAIVMEVVKGGQGARAADTAGAQEKREKLASMIDGLVDSVEVDGERIVVVNVNTPAVDLQKDFAPAELNYIRDDIFREIRRQLGAEFQPEVAEHWASAFSAMMDVVKEEKNRN